LLSRKVTGI